MPYTGFTVNEIIKICCDIASIEGIMVQQPRVVKRSVLRRFNKDINNLSVKVRRSCSLNSDVDWTGNRSNSIRQCMHKSESSPSIAIDTDDNTADKEEMAKKNIPGLRGRDVVAIAILVDKKGTPIKTYTEHEPIPSDEYEAATQVFMSRVPFPESDPKNKETTPTSDVNAKALVDVLTDEMDVVKANSLKKRMSHVLIKLHTTDLSTALSFLKLDRFAHVREEIKSELLTFVKKDLKMTSVCKFSLWV